MRIARMQGSTKQQADTGKRGGRHARHRKNEPLSLARSLLKRTHFGHNLPVLTGRWHWSIVTPKTGVKAGEAGVRSDIWTRPLHWRLFFRFPEKENSGRIV
jgi:hypothetical protein